MIGALSSRTLALGTCPVIFPCPSDEKCPNSLSVGKRGALARARATGVQIAPPLAVEAKSLMFISLCAVRSTVIGTAPNAVERAINAPKRTKRLTNYAVAARLVVPAYFGPSGLRRVRSRSGPSQPALRQSATLRTRYI